MPLADFSRPITTGMRTHLLTARAAARHMVERGAGVILTLTASAVRLPDPVMGPPLMGGFGVACAAIESLTMNLAGELGPLGIRVVCLRSEELPDADEVANVAAFVASVRASAMTATVANVTCGSVVD
jgi:3-oxoacyl-[acyl-carrier protein] reductase